MFRCHSIVYSFAVDGIRHSDCLSTEMGRARILRFVRYTLTGGFATATHYAILLVLVESRGVPAPTATALGALGGALVAYFANRRFTFSSAARHRRALPRFFVVAALGAGLNSLIVWVGTSALSWHYLAAQAVATVVILALTYHINRSWTFVC